MPDQVGVIDLSRQIESGKDERGRYYIETLVDADRCRYLIEEVCCNADNREMVADFPFEEDCNEKRCPYFVAEKPEEIEALKKGVKTYE